MLLYNYAIQAGLKNATGINTSKLPAKSDLASLKAEADKLDIDKLVPVPIELGKLSDVVKNDVVKKTVYEKLVAKVNSINTSGFALKTKYDTDRSELENKISDTSGLVKNADYIAKITEIEDKIPNISGLATTSALTAVECKTPDVSSLAKKTDYNTKITEIEKKLTDHDHDQYITFPVFNNLTLPTAVPKTDFDDKLKSLNQKINSNKTKHLPVENELKKLQKFDSVYFRGKSYFEEDGTQSYLVFKPMYRSFKRFACVGSDSYIYFWKSKGLSDENITAPTTSDYSLYPQLSYLGAKKE